MLVLHTLLLFAKEKKLYKLFQSIPREEPSLVSEFYFSEKLAQIVELYNSDIFSYVY